MLPSCFYIHLICACVVENGLVFYIVGGLFFRNIRNYRSLGWERFEEMLKRNICQKACSFAHVI